VRKAIFCEIKPLFRLSLDINSICFRKVRVLAKNPPAALEIGGTLSTVQCSSFSEIIAYPAAVSSLLRI
jgi:hypothetical protein